MAPGSHPHHLIRALISLLTHSHPTTILFSHTILKPNFGLPRRQDRQWSFPSQNPSSMLNTRPPLRIRMNTSHSNDQHPFHLHNTELTFQLLISSFHQLPSLPTPPHPIHQHEFPTFIHGPSSSSHFQNHHSIAVHICLLCRNTTVDILGCEVTHCPSWDG
ncbi:unnamed protein product [Linum tenue]|uniref:Uncharacterized protein n=1 Tax=Linum tenue TaxID=586396 RepID=A0AAV0IF15_9ROSI|nr:unnamed protein product [Linum tenue]